MVLSGSLPYFNEFFEMKEAQAEKCDWTWRDAAWYSDEDLQWFYDRGCKWVKVEAEPGDLILWDSRTIHYGAHAQGKTPRVAACEYMGSCRPDRQMFAINRQETFSRR